jgi:hypothetical protein
MEPITQAAPASFAACDPDAQLFERRLRLDDDGVGAGIHQRFRLLGEGGAHVVFGEVAVRLHKAAERTDIADDVAGAAVERLAGDLDSGAVDGDGLIAVAVAVQHEARSAEGVGEEAVGPGFGIPALDGEDTLGMGEVPFLAAVSLFEAGEHQLRAHGAVGEQRPELEGLEEWGHGVEDQKLTAETRRAQR